jgi:hypothetical protein
MRRSKLRLFLLSLGGLSLLGVVAFIYFQKVVIAQVSGSHVEANVPPTSEFDADLSRDLTEWFTHRQGSPATIRFEMLRRGATQSGVAYPKYYAWVEVQTASAPDVRGAVRIAAVERDRFEVLQFLPADEIRTRPDAVQSVFPAALVPDVLRRASQP